ncbi:unnamed protein product [Diatraea saccharalis]|uniref:Uncharacterized protein n=1 Tax=Diatraea saccharalis TaxID=40085 RepID=A0A9P0CB26_9NEOP|nr:unnamed protein product [Diatraea saccharalis]
MFRFAQVGLLMLLSQWLSYCPAAVSAFLNIPGGVGYLVNQTCSNEHDENEYLLQGLSAFLLAICIHFNDDSVENYSKDSLKQLLVKRIGMETFMAKLSEVTKHESYNRAAKHPQLRVKSPSEMLIDYEFCRLFKSLENVLTESLSVKQENGVSGRGDDALQQYKSLIRQQDARLHELAAQLDALLQQNQRLQSTLNDSLASNSHLKDENTLLKAQLSAVDSLPNQSQTPREDARFNEYEAKVREYEVRVKESELRVKETEAKVKESETRIQELTGQVSKLSQELTASREEHRMVTEELDRLKKDQDDLLELLADQEVKLNEYKMTLMSLGHTVEDPPSDQNLT